MKKLIVANWKMNPDSPGRAAALAVKYGNIGISIPDWIGDRNIELVVAPPFPFLIPVGSTLTKGTKLGAQDAFWADAGPYTGEVSWHQLKHLKVEYVIIGHSERRIHLGETDEMIAKKIRAVLENRLAAILCIGERERTGADIPSSVGDQLKAALTGVKKEFLKRLVVAYEPIWAISTMPGSNGPDTPDGAFRARLYIEKIIAGLYGRQAGRNVRIIYGGSIKAANAAAYLAEGRMDGLLVGGVSLDPKEFGRIAAEVARAASAK